jgi:hypothetical protein
LKEAKGNFYVFMALADPWVKNHLSYHASGQRHFKVGLKGREPDKLFVSSCQPTSALRGVELLLKTAILRGQFQKLRIHKASAEPAIVLDADAADFRDDVVFVRVFLVEPDSEPKIPDALHSGPPLLHVIKETEPWVGIAFFQQSEGVFLHDGVVEVRQG